MTQPLATALDLDAYFRRIGFSGPAGPRMETLEALHRLHQGAIPFENLDVLLGRPVRLDLESLQAKLVAGGRGGYCFEQNTLFAAVLDALGFSVTKLEARVRPPGAPGLLPRTHGVLQVDLDGRAWLADVGFGGDGILGPVPLDGAEQERHGDRHRVAPEGRLRVLQAWAGGAWQDRYAILPEPVHPIDWEVANHYTSTCPASIFRHALTVQDVTPALRRALRGRTCTETRNGVAQARELRDEEIVPLLANGFGLRLPEGFTLPAAAPK
jgi:N-hydroxyarylamine O-acetyltransferase